MFVLSVDLRIKPENVESFIAKAVENSADSRKEPGCRQFDVLVDPTDRTQVMLYEVYVDEKAFDAHQQTAHFKKYIAEAVPLLASRRRHVWERRSEEHTSELQSRLHLVCRLLLEKKKKKHISYNPSKKKINNKTNK